METRHARALAATTSALCLALLFCLRANAEDDPGQAMPSTSPNGRFVFRQLDDEDPPVTDRETRSTQAVFDTKTHRRVFVFPPYAGDSFGDTIRTVWSKDSRRLAVNYRAGGRYYCTSLFEIDGTNFRELPDPEETLTAPLARAKIEQIKSLGLTADAYQRRINDTFTTRRWIDGNTIEADGSSESTVVVKGADGEDIEEISASLRCILKFDPATMRWEIVKSRKLENE